MQSIHPIPGLNFMSLNMTDEQLEVVLKAAIKKGGEAEEAIAGICREWLVMGEELVQAQAHLADFIDRLPAHSENCGCETCELRSYIEHEMGN